MAEFKQTVTKTEDEGVDATTGTQVEQQTQTVETVSADPKRTAQNAVWYLLGFVLIVLGLRFALKLFGANPNNGFVDFVYNVSGVLSGPFDTIFGVTTATTENVRSVFEPSIIVAALVYSLVAWGIVKLITLNQNRTTV